MTPEQEDVHVTDNIFGSALNKKGFAKVFACLFDLDNFYNIKSSRPSLISGWPKHGMILLSCPSTGAWQTSGLTFLWVAPETQRFQTHRTCCDCPAVLDQLHPHSITLLLYVPFNPAERLQHLFSAFDVIWFCLHPNDQPWINWVTYTCYELVNAFS